MAKRVFFSFDYEDVKTFRANVVRNHDLLKRDVEGVGFFDASIWEDAKRHGDVAVKRLIDSNLENTSVTCVLIGTRTWQRRWVRYELLKSFDRGNRLLGININGVRDKNQQIFSAGRDPFVYLGFIVSSDGTRRYYYEHDGAEWKQYNDLGSKSTSYGREHWGKGFQLSNWVPCYDWINDGGYEHFPMWVDSAK